jgi:trimethylamine--corrinoid protein Co-methyltransferase
MKPLVRVLSDDDVVQVHERTLGLLAGVGVRVDTERGRLILAGAGAAVEEGSRVVRFPRPLVEEALRLAPRRFTLGGRRPGWTLPMNEGSCTLMVDGEAIHTYDVRADVRRPATYDDWVTATDLIDALDEVGVYWRMVQAGLAGDTAVDAVRHWSDTFRRFSKHVQDQAATPAEARWLLEVLEVVFGDRAAVTAAKPFSFLVCPHSPLVLEEAYTDAYLETLGWGIPLAVMPMPLMGLSSPASLLATIVQGNAEVLAMLCLVQAGAPGTPFIYAPAFAVMEPRSGRFGGGAVEHALLGAATTEMARHYGLPAEASTGGTDQHVPGIQAAYERALNWELPVLAWPDILVGPGLLGGSMILSLEQLLIDLEVFRRCQRLREGIGSPTDGRLDDLLAEVGPGQTFIDHRSTRDALRAGEWHIGRLGVQGTYEQWEEAGRPDIVEQAHAEVTRILANHRSLPLDDVVERELDLIRRRAEAGA